LLDTVRQAATAALPPAADDVPDLVPYGPEAKKALELTFREALRLGHNYIGTEHLLLALLEHENGDGVLSDLGITKPATEEYIAKVLGLLREQKNAAAEAAGAAEAAAGKPEEGGAEAGGAG
ncbi:Clp protease N-terminal domain-containing protein, partial [Streptomyces sp. NPDC059627]